MLVAPANTPRDAGQDNFDAVEIKKRILERQETISSVARKIRKARNTVSRCIHHPSVHPAVRRKTLKYLGLL